MCKHAASHVNEGLKRCGFLPASHCKVSKSRWDVAEIGVRLRRQTEGGRRPAPQLLMLALGDEAARCGKAGSTQGCSQAVPHPSTNRALCRLTSEVRRDPVHSTRYGRERLHLMSQKFEHVAFLGGPFYLHLKLTASRCCNMLCCGMLSQICGCLADMSASVRTLLGSSLPCGLPAANFVHEMSKHTHDKSHQALLPHRVLSLGRKFKRNASANECGPAMNKKGCMTATAQLVP